MRRIGARAFFFSGMHAAHAAQLLINNVWGVTRSFNECLCRNQRRLLSRVSCLVPFVAHRDSGLGGVSGGNKLWRRCLGRCRCRTCPCRCSLSGASRPRCCARGWGSRYLFTARFFCFVFFRRRESPGLLTTIGWCCCQSPFFLYREATREPAPTPPLADFLTCK